MHYSKLSKEFKLAFKSIDHARGYQLIDQNIIFNTLIHNLTGSPTQNFNTIY